MRAFIILIHKETGTAPRMACQRQRTVVRFSFLVSKILGPRLFETPYDFESLINESIQFSPIAAECDALNITNLQALDKLLDLVL